MWQDNTEAIKIKKNWKQANMYCENLTLSGFNNWRLSTVQELKVLHKNRFRLSNRIPINYWTSTEGKFVSSAYMMNFFDAGEALHAQKYFYNIRCVREN